MILFLLFYTFLWILDFFIGKGVCFFFLLFILRQIQWKLLSFGLFSRFLLPLWFFLSIKKCILKMTHLLTYSTFEVRVLKIKEICPKILVVCQKDVILQSFAKVHLHTNSSKSVDPLFKSLCICLYVSP